jgi:hypothetical protein
MRPFSGLTLATRRQIHGRQLVALSSAADGYCGANSAAGIPSTSPTAMIAEPARR